MIPKTVKEICELFDAEVMADIGVYQFKEQTCFYIGAPDEPSAGLYGFQLTPTFFSRSALERYCKSRKGREEINRRAAEIFPDWDVENQEWPDETEEWPPEPDDPPAILDSWPPRDELGRVLRD